MSGSDRFWFLFAAYGVVWGLLALFLMYLGRRTRELERDLRTLEERMAASSRR
jgi:CcmD family protein